MNRKQVYNFLKVMMKDKSRAGLEVAYVDDLYGKPVLVATDGYILTAVYLGEEAKDYVGKRISREAIEKWYKLADGKSRLTAESLQDLMEDDAHNGWQPVGEYPKWQQLIPSTDSAMQDMSMAFNADFVKVVQDLNNSQGVHIKLYGKLAPMVIDDEVSFSLIMPMKG